MTDYSFAKIFVSGPRNLDRVFAEVVELTGGIRDHWTVTGPLGDIAIHPNPDARGGPKDDFLFWPYLVEVCPDPKVPPGEVVAAVSALLTGFWSNGWNAVTAADYEDELPRKGGMMGA